MRRDRVQELLALATICLVATGLRSYYFSRVFRRDDVLLIQVDPWRYRFQIERLTTRAAGPLDVAAFVDPGRDDLMIAALGWFAEVLGGSAGVVGSVLAVYPVVVAVFMCVLAYVAGRLLIGGTNGGLSAALVLALTPAHVYRTALGFGDHHAFDYLLLAVTLVSILFVLHTPKNSRNRWVAVVVLGVVLSAQVLAWSGGVLLLIPYVGFCFVLLISTVWSRRPVLTTVGPLVLSLGFATVLTAVAVTSLSWQTMDVVVLLTVSAVALGGLLGFSQLCGRLARPAVTVGGLVAAATIIPFVVWWGIPTAADTVEAGLTYFSSTNQTLLEATSVFGGTDPASTLVSFFGLLGAFFLPALVWYTLQWPLADQPGWLAVTTYAWYFLALSALQRRFVGELSFFFALLTGFAVVYAIGRAGRFGRTDEASPPRSARADVSSRTLLSDVRTLFVVTLVGTLVLSMTVVQVPLMMNERTVTDAEYEATQHIEAYADRLELNRSNGYVFSPTASNLMYNYYAHGEEVTFTYARRNYARFATSTESAQWYRELTRRGTGFVVTTDGYDVGGRTTLHQRLHHHDGSVHGPSDGLGQHMLFRSDDGSTTVHALVAGALITGAGSQDQTAIVRARADTATSSFMYERRPAVTANGRYGVIVPYPGTYRVGDRTVGVSAADIRQGKTVGATGREAYWAFDETRGQIIFDQIGGYHAVAENVSWVSGVRNDSLSVTTESRVMVRDFADVNVEDDFTLSLWVRTRESVDYRESMPFPRIVSTSPAGRYQQTKGYQIALSNGRVVGAIGDGNATAVYSPEIDDGRWHHIVLTWDGTELALFVDGVNYGTRQAEVTPAEPSSLAIGASTDYRRQFSGYIDEVRLRDEAVSADSIRIEYNATRRAMNETAAS